LKGENSL